MSRASSAGSAIIVPAACHVTLAGFPTHVQYAPDYGETYDYEISSINGSHVLQAATVEWWGPHAGWEVTAPASVSLSYNGSAYYPIGDCMARIWVAWLGVDALYCSAGVEPGSSLYGYSFGNLFTKAVRSAAAAIGGGFVPQYGPYENTSPASPWGSVTIDSWS